MMWSYGENNHAYGNIRFVVFCLFWGHRRQKKESIVLNWNFLLDQRIFLSKSFDFYSQNIFSSKNSTSLRFLKTPPKTHHNNTYSYAYPHKLNIFSHCLFNTVHEITLFFSMLHLCFDCWIVGAYSFMVQWSARMRGAAFTISQFYKILQSYMNSGNS